MDQHFLLPNFRFPFAISLFFIVTADDAGTPKTNCHTLSWDRLGANGKPVLWPSALQNFISPLVLFFFLQTSVGENHRRKGLSFKLLILLTGSASKLLTVLQTTKTKHNQVKLTCLINFWVTHNFHSGNIFWNNQLQCKQHEVILTDLKSDRETQRT